MADIENLVDRIQVYLRSPSSKKNLGLESADLFQSDLEDRIQVIPEQGLDFIEAALQKAESGTEPLTRFELLGLEAIILLVNRPAIDVTLYGLRDVPEAWRLLSSKYFWQSNYGRRNAYASGKVQVPVHNDLKTLGSAILIADNVVITNRHVVEFAEGTLGSRIRPSSSMIIDFGSFFNSQREIILPVNGCNFRSGHFDIACLETSPIDTKQELEPVLIENPSVELSKREAYIIGYPFSDQDEDVEVLAEVFGFERGTKRLSPGKITGFGNCRIMHDCSTLKGSSGSGLFCIRSGHLLGLHFSGTRRINNYAISIPQILSHLPEEITSRMCVVTKDA